MRTILFIGILFISCNSEKQKISESETSKKEYDMYVPSEMATHMNRMFDIQENIKSQIQSGIIPNEFPEEILKIHTAKLSDFKERNQTFEAFSHLFLERFELIFDTTSSVPLKQRYNDVVNLCISCHQTECTGPIPRIQKLIIK
tara:strand:+ start:18386 stop:18817 length:432 start_codon:yes stop_codon:yes gene_type:complete